MELEELIERLKIWNIVIGNHNMVALLEGTQTPEEYAEKALLNSKERMKKLLKDLEEEQEKEEPGKLLTTHYIRWMKETNERQERVNEYLQSKRKKE